MKTLNKNIPIFFINSKIDQLPDSQDSSETQITERDLNRQAIENKMVLLKSYCFEVSALTQDGLYESIFKIIELGIVHQCLRKAEKYHEKYTNKEQRGAIPLVFENFFSHDEEHAIPRISELEEKS